MQYILSTIIIILLIILILITTHTHIYIAQVHWGRAASRTVDTGQRRLGVELHAQTEWLHWWKWECDASLFPGWVDAVIHLQWQRRKVSLIFCSDWKSFKGLLLGA